MAAAHPHALQDTFLEHVRKHDVPVTVFLASGTRLQGTVAGFDSYALLLVRDRHSQLIYKHAISTIVPSEPDRMANIPRRLWNPVCRRPDEMEFGCEQRFQLGFPTADVGEEGVEGGAEVSKLRVVFVVEHLSLYEPPEALDHVEVWGVAWQVNRLNPAGFAPDPFLDLARYVV